ncbi:phage tail protein [Pseudomonas chlororaphis]|uniref:phage tail protein n=1 Tax=Pseudomonas chlororaphis TaxID=587753 RepID=UPI001E4AF1E9|nr:phage tail protein [Pseudomonas chlororaphis]MCB2254646.1 phage tail protein [Pseudomonas chlororaphis]
MDYPKRVPGVGLLNGKFVDENPIAGTPGSLIPATWGNAVTQEILSVINSAGLLPSEDDNGQLLQALQEIVTKASPMSSSVTNVSASKLLTNDDLGLVLINAVSSAITVSLPPANKDLGVRDVVLRRIDNAGNRLVVQASGADKIKFHTHLAADGYPFFVLMGAGDWWHLRSDGAGAWWPVGRFDGTPLGRPVFETTTAFSPGGYGALNGAILSRAEWPWLWDHAKVSGMMWTEATRVGAEGGWSSGDGALTFRGPEGRGEFLRVLDEGRGIDPGRNPGVVQRDQNRAHIHTPTAVAVGEGEANGAIFQTSVWSMRYTFPYQLVGTTPVGTGLSTDGGAEARPHNVAYPGRLKLI